MQRKWNYAAFLLMVNQAFLFEGETKARCLVYDHIISGSSCISSLEVSYTKRLVSYRSIMSQNDDRVLNIHMRYEAEVGM